MGRSHLATGLAAGAWTASAASLVGVPDPLPVLAGLVCGYAALLPDLDHRRSTASYSLGPLTLAVSWLLTLFVDHRGPTHTPRGALVFGALAAVGAVWLPAPLGGWAALLWGVAVWLGCLVHIWADARTVSGVPWRGRWRRVELGGRTLWRTNGGRLRIGRTFVTGSAYEQWRLRVIYVPVSVGSWVAALLIIGG